MFLYIWYSNSTMRVKWGNVIGRSFLFSNGVRQGSCLSPLLFAMYVDDVIINICKMPYALRRGKSKLNILAFADDIVLLAPTMYGTQILLNAIVKHFDNLQIEINTDKTKLMCFNATSTKWSLPRTGTVSCGGRLLERVQEYKYLGILITSSNALASELEKQRRSVLRKGYSILHKFRMCDNKTLGYLLGTFCFSFYGSEIWDLKNNKCNQQWRRLRVSYHDIIKKAAKLPRMTSNHIACASMNLKTLDKLIVGKQCTFFLSLLCNSNPLTKWLMEDGIFLQKSRSQLISIGCNSPNITASRIKQILGMIDFFYI